MQKQVLHILNNEKGLAAIEFAFVLPLLVMLLCGVAEYGWLMKTRMALNHAVSEGTRAAIRLPTAAQRSTSAKSQTCEALANLTNDKIAMNLSGFITTSDMPATSEFPERFSVSVKNWPYKPLVGFVPVPSTISAKTVMALPE